MKKVEKMACKKQAAFLENYDNLSKKSSSATEEAEILHLSDLKTVYFQDEKTKSNHEAIR